jgi:putative transposase
MSARIFSVMRSSITAVGLRSNHSLSSKSRRVPSSQRASDSLEEAGDKLFTFTRFPPSQWKSIRTSNAVERLDEEFKRRIKTQTVPPCAETAAMLFWALLASGQITMRKVDGWQTLADKLSDQIIDLAA